MIVPTRNREIALTGGTSRLETNVIGVPSRSGGGPWRPLPDPLYVLVYPDEHENAFLVRFGRNGEFAGDTWHETLEAAKSRAQELFPNLSQWLSVPDSIEDLLAFARANLQSE